jgi:hypothetical protein
MISPGKELFTFLHNGSKNRMRDNITPLTLGWATEWQLLSSREWQSTETQ